MGLISVDSAGLAALAADCEHFASAVTSDRDAPAVSGGLSATTAAVLATHGDLEDAAHRIAQRLRLTGREASAAATGFAVTEAHNTRHADEVGQSATVTV